MSQTAPAYEHLREARTGDGSRIPDFLLGACVAAPLTVVPGTPTLSVLATAGIAILATFRTPPPLSKLPWWAPVIVTSMCIWMTLSMVVNGLSNYFQLGYFLTWALAILAVASGRIDRLSVCRGVAAGLFLGCVAGLASRFAGIGTNTYPGRLTGSIWGDPNQAGYILAVLTPIALVGLRRGWRRWLPLTLFTVCMILTLSRTSLLAMTVSSLWFIIRRRVSPTLGVVVIGGLGLWLQGQVEQLKYWGPFVQRDGSDRLRERIDAASAAQVSEKAWMGHGPGTATVQVESNSFFFHNAYLAVRNNGGWILLGLLMILIGLVVARLLTLPPEQHHPWHEAAVLAVMICAMSLGEVFLRAPAALAIGLALRHVINPYELRVSDGEKSPDHIL